MTVKTDTGMNQPDVTIGLPVYNGAATVNRAIEAILEQTHKHFHLVISDNASTDDTPAICKAFAARDPRVEYVRHDENMGALKNFRFVLEKARTPFFMWAAHDDWLGKDVVGRCRQSLLDNAGAVAALPEIVMHTGEAATRKARGAAAIRGPVAARLARFLMRPADNSRYYGLYRTEMLKKSFAEDLPEVPGSDWVVSALTLVQGEHIGVPGAVLNRTAAEQGRYARQLRSARVPAMDRWVPTVSMSRELIHRLSWPLTCAALPSLLFLAVHQALWLRWVNFRRIRHGGR